MSTENPAEDLTGVLGLYWKGERGRNWKTKMEQDIVITMARSRMIETASHKHNIKMTGIKKEVSKKA